MRPTWHEYFMKMAELAASRSTCLRRKVGAVLVRNNHVLATGYNGAPRGLKHCAITGCLREKLHIPSGERHEICRGVHAEQNAVIQAAVHGISIKNAALYCTTFPCSVCARILINSCISQIFVKEHYADSLSKELLADAQIPIFFLDENYKVQT